MRTTLLFICLLLFSCKNQEAPSPIIIKEDTTRISLVRHLLNLRNELEHIETKDSILANILFAKRQAIDSMVDNALDLKENKISLILVSKKYDKVLVEKDYLVKKIDSVKRENIKLYGENGKLSNEIEFQEIKNSKLTTENLKLKK